MQDLWLVIHPFLLLFTRRIQVSIAEAFFSEILEMLKFFQKRVCGFEAQ